MPNAIDSIAGNFGVPSPGAINDKLIAFFSRMHTGEGSPEGAVTAVVGHFYFDLTNGTFYGKQSGSGNTGWVDLGEPGSAGDMATDPLWGAAGDLAIGTADNTATRLAIGTALQVLRTNAGATAPEWASLAAQTTMANDALWDAVGDLAVGTGANTGGRLAKGTALQSLRMNAAATTPEWAAPFVWMEKTGDTTITTDIVVGAEAELSFAIAASEVWYFEFNLFYISPTLADLKVTITGPASPTLVRYQVAGLAAATTGAAGQWNAAIATAFATELALGGGAVDVGGRVFGFVRNGANAGTVALAWAQNASDAGNTTLYTGSYSRATRIA